MNSSNKPGLETFRQHVRLRSIAAANRISEEELLQWSAYGKINPGIWASGWFAAPTTKEINGRYSTGAFVLLDEEWLYPKSAYFLDLLTKEETAGGLYRSKPSGPVDRWAQLKNGKPRFSRDDLWIPIDEVQRVQEEAKRRSGRYTLEEAARFLEAEGGERFDTVLRKLISAAESGELPMFDPGENVRVDYGQKRRPRDFYEQTHGEDLNSWLSAYEPRVRVRFPTSIATSDGSSTDSRPITRQRWQEDTIVATLNALGFDPVSMPRNAAGKPGIKSTVKAKCRSHDPGSWYGTVFEKAWQRCLSSHLIAYAEDR